MTTTIRVALWVCPSCKRYYASSSADDLRRHMNTDNKNQPTFPRSRCQHCNVDRQAHIIGVEV